MDNTITIHNIEQYTQQIINGHLVLTRIFPNPSHPSSPLSLDKIKRMSLSQADDPSVKRDLEFTIVGQEYAQIKRSTAGNNLFRCYCYDGVFRTGENICDKMLHPGDIVRCTLSSLGLMGLLHATTDHATEMYIVQKYTADEARNLKSYGELPDSVIINETD